MPNSIKEKLRGSSAIIFGRQKFGSFVAVITVISFLLLAFAKGPSQYWKNQSLSSIRYTSSNQPAVGLIPKHIWQIFFYAEANNNVFDSINSWLIKNPDCSYTRLSKSGAMEFVEQNYQHRPDLVQLYNDLTLPVLKGDLLRWMVLAARGGVYADMDVTAEQPLKKWLPKYYRNQVAAVVGIEYDKLDAEERLSGFSWDVQFCSWTLATAPGHPLVQLGVDRIASSIYAMAKRENLPIGELEPDDDEILQSTGPGAWTAAVYESLSEAAGRPVGPEDVTGLEEPKLFGDILVLPIDSFATNVPHSGAGKHPEQALVRHGFFGSWRGSGEEEHEE